MSFATAPQACQLKLEPFQVNVSERDVDELQQLLRLSRIGPQVYENESKGNANEQFGLTHNIVTEAVDYWRTKFDWRQQEQRINEFPQFTTTVQDRQQNPFKLHFMALFSSKPDAIPILFCHGWPGQYCEFLSLFKLLKDRYKTSDQLPYTVIAPSLPGFVWSDRPPLNREWEPIDTPYVLNQLMTGLGFNAYVAQGGDIGSITCRLLSINFEACKLVHLNFVVLTRHTVPKDLSTFDTKTRKRLERTNEFFTRGVMYARLQGTKPGTLGFVLSSNPISLFCWVYEKFRAWSDETPCLDDIILSASLYWFSNCISSSWPTYRQNTAADQSKGYIEKPFGFSCFPFELAGYPKEWVADTGNLVWYKEHDNGGHFAAVEKPQVLLQDVESFIDQEWSKVKDAKL
ncbi:hypothetical protein OIO90_004951 [Microbotryomycetes sp. JL221]|nr:hypothetical protein OIO90_004951 [Microbotryomycetes sp. JL221]